MSSKGSKRRQRRINTHEEEPEKKIEEIIELSDDSKSNISADTDKLEKDTLVKEEKSEQQSAKEPEPAITIQNGKETNNTLKESSETKTDSVETSNGEVENDITNSQSTENSEMQKSVGNDENSDLEPLVFDSEDTELQCQSETPSDRSSEIDKSPILNRCQTRRSQTRNVPTPKTPKSLDFNGDAECKSEVRVNVTRLTVAPEVIVTPPVEDSEEIESQDNVSDSTINAKPEETNEVCEDSDEDLANASVFVNYTGNDTTRNFDITTTSTQEDDSPSFLETTKDLSYGETLRCIGGRKGLRQHYANHAPRFYKSTNDLTSKDLTDAVKKYTPAPSSGQKRKLNANNRDSSPDEYKRVKIDGDTGTSGIMSFIQSPFQTKPGRTEIPSSTPKLTSFKYTPHHQGSTVIDEVSKIDLELHHERPNITTAESKKWCSIM